MFSVDRLEFCTAHVAVPHVNDAVDDNMRAAFRIAYHTTHILTFLYHQKLQVK
jgi:hypothetical protein